MMASFREMRRSLGVTEGSPKLNIVLYLYHFLSLPPPTPPLNPLTDPTVCAPRTIPYPTLLPFHKQHIFLEKKPQLLCGFPRVNPTRQGLRAPSKVKLRRQRQLLHRMRKANNAFRLKTSELATFLHVFVNQVSTYRSFFCRISP